MRIHDIAVPEIYKSSSDFRFFLKWIELALERVRHDTENLVDLYDPLRCPEQLLWMLGDTVGYKYDDRLPASFNRLVLLYFMSMIRHKGSKDGVTLAAEVNLAQFNLLEYIKQSDIFYNRLEDTSIPVNSVYVTSHTEDGYIEVVYFSEQKPIDACIEYVRPLGMYLFDHAGVRYDGRTKISVDARLTNTNDLNTSVGPTRVGHYRREDYARLQKTRHQTSIDHINANGQVTWDVTFAEIDDTWLLAKVPKVTRDRVTLEEAQGQVKYASSDGSKVNTYENNIIYTVEQSNGVYTLRDNNSQLIGCSKSGTIGSSGSTWEIDPVDQNSGTFYIHTVDPQYYLASDLHQSGKFRAYSSEVIESSDVGSFSRQFHIYKYDDSCKEFIRVMTKDAIVTGQYVLMTREYAVGVMDNSGTVVGTGSGVASVAAVQTRDLESINRVHVRSKSYYRNSDSEQSVGATVDAGYRALYNLQVCNNEHVVRANLPTIFGLGYKPQAHSELPIDTYDPKCLTKRLTSADLFDRLPWSWNLGYDKTRDEAHTYGVVTPPGQDTQYDVSTVRTGTPDAPVPAVNPPRYRLGDAISLGQNLAGKLDTPEGYNKFYSTEYWIRDDDPDTPDVIRPVDTEDSDEN